LLVALIASLFSEIGNFCFRGKKMSNLQTSLQTDLKTLLDASAERHRDHLCPRQVLGVRMGQYAGELLGLDLPQCDKRLFTFVESDGCLTDGIAAATNCWWGSRTMYLMDYGKTAATFVDTQTDRAVRIWPTRESRRRALEYAPDASDHWHAQLIAYQVMPASELLQAQSVLLTVSLRAMISHHGDRVVCDRCGEDIINERHVQIGGQNLCRTCAGNGYYQIVAAEPVHTLICAE
jgi:formylmethanofuran dehydrogenase subunit E